MSLRGDLALPLMLINLMCASPSIWSGTSTNERLSHKHSIGVLTLTIDIT